MKVFWWQKEGAGMARELQPCRASLAHPLWLCVGEVSAALLLPAGLPRPVLLPRVTAPCRKDENVLTEHQRMVARPWLALAQLCRLGSSLRNTAGLWNAASWVAAIAAWRSVWSYLLRSPKGNKRRLLPCTMSVFPARMKRQEPESFYLSAPNLKKEPWGQPSPRPHF